MPLFGCIHLKELSITKSKKTVPFHSFYDNSAFSLDDALAAADIVVVQNSGVGGDALVKGKLVVVLSVDGAPLGHGAELVQSWVSSCEFI